MGNHVIRDRIRKSRKLGRCSKGAALAYPWIYLVADEWGRFEFRAHMIHAETFGPRMDFAPEDTPTVADVAGWLAEYEREGLLVRYHLDGDLAYWVGFAGMAEGKRKPSAFPDPAQFKSGCQENGPSFKSGCPEPSEAQVQSAEARTKVVVTLPDNRPVTVPRTGTVTTPLPPAGAGDSDSVRQVFEFWQTAMGHSDAKLLPRRRRLIQQRLREGYTVAQLCDAVAGCKASPFHMGRNDSGTVYDDLTLICRSGEKVEFFRNKLQGGTGLVLAEPLRTGKQSAEDKTMEAIRKAYERRSGEGAA